MNNANDKDLQHGLRLRRVGGQRPEDTPMALDVNLAMPKNDYVTTPSSSSSSSSDNHFNGFRFHFPGFMKQRQHSSERDDTVVEPIQNGDGIDDEDYVSSSSSSSVVCSPLDKSSRRSFPKGRLGHKATGGISSFPTMKRMKSLFKHHKVPLRSTKKLRLDCVDFSGDDEGSSLTPVLQVGSHTEAHRPSTVATEYESCLLPQSELSSDGTCTMNDTLTAIRQIFNENGQVQGGSVGEGSNCHAGASVDSNLPKARLPDTGSSVKNATKDCDVRPKERRPLNPKVNLENNRRLNFSNGTRFNEGNKDSQHRTSDGHSFAMSLQNDGDISWHCNEAPVSTSRSEKEDLFNDRCSCRGCHRKIKQISGSVGDNASQMPSKMVTRVGNVKPNDDQGISNNPKQSFDLKNKVTTAACPRHFHRVPECQITKRYDDIPSNGLSCSNSPLCNHMTTLSRRRPKHRDYSPRNLFTLGSSSSSEKDETDDDNPVCRSTSSPSFNGNPLYRKLRTVKRRPLRRNTHKSPLSKENTWQHFSPNRRQDYLDDVEVVPETPVGLRRRHRIFHIDTDSSSSEAVEANDIPKQHQTSSDLVIGDTEDIPHSKPEKHVLQSSDSMSLNLESPEIVASMPCTTHRLQEEITSPMIDAVRNSRQMELDEAYARALQAQFNSEEFLPGRDPKEMPTVNKSSDAVTRFPHRSDRSARLTDDPSINQRQDPQQSDLDANRHCKNANKMNSSNRDGRIDEMSFGMPPNSQCPARTQNRHMCEASANSNCVDSHDRIFARRQCSCGIDGIHPDLDLLSMAERLDDEDDNNNTYVVLRPLMSQRRRSGSRSQLGRRFFQNMHAPDLDNEHDILGLAEALSEVPRSQTPVSRNLSSDSSSRGTRRTIRASDTSRYPIAADRAASRNNQLFNSREGTSGSQSDDEAPLSPRRLSTPLHLRLPEVANNFNQDLHSSVPLPSPGEFEAVNSVLQMEMDESLARMLQAQFNAESEVPNPGETSVLVSEGPFATNQRAPHHRVRSSNISGNQPQGSRQTGRRTPTQQPLLSPARYRANVGRLRYPVDDIGVHRAQFPPGLEEPLLTYPISPRRTRSQTRRARSTAGIMGHQDNFRHLFGLATFGVVSDESDSDMELQTLTSNDDELDNMYLLLGPIVSSPRRTNGRSLVGRRNQRRGRAIDIGNDYEELLELAERLGHVSKGLTKGQMNRLPTYPFKKGTKNTEAGVDNCHICMSDYEEGEMLRVLPCFHEFHMKCIDKWLWEKDTCPVCRLKVVTN